MDNQIDNHAVGGEAVEKIAEITPVMGEAGLLQKIIAGTEKVIEPLTDHAVMVSGAMLCFLTLLTTVNVVMRYLADSPIVWAYEVSQLTLGLVCSLAFAGAAARKINIHVSVFTDRLPEGIRRNLLTVVDFIAFLICVLIAWQLLAYSVGMIETKQATALLRLSKFPFAMVLGVGFTLTAIVLFKDFLRSLSQAPALQRKSLRDSLWLLVMAVILLGIMAFPVWGRGIVELTPMTLGIIGVVFTLILLFLHLTVGFGLAVIGFIGIAYLRGFEPALGLVGRTTFAWCSHYTLSVMPLFILMGLFAAQSGLVKDLYDTVYKWIGHLKGGLAMTTVGVGALFGAVCGDNVAGAATMSVVTLPEMRRFKYNESLSTGTICAAGPLANLIPPSMGFIVYGLITDTSVGRLFMAGIIPGIINALIFMATIYIWCRFRPEMGPPGEKTAWRQRFISLKGTVPVSFFFVLIIGGIYMGVFTPVEAAGVGAFGLFIYVVLRGKLSKSLMRESLYGSASTTVMIFLIFIGAIIFSYFLASCGVPKALETLVKSLPVPREVIIGVIWLIYVILGCFLEALSMMLFTIPVFVPVVVSLGYSKVWFGVMMVLMSDVALITPPMGMVVFVVSGLSKVPVYTIFRGVLPFVIALLVFIGMLTVWPEIATFLPDLMMGKGG